MANYIGQTDCGISITMEGFLSISFILINTLSMLYYWYHSDQSFNLIWEGKRWIFFE